MKGVVDIITIIIVTCIVVSIGLMLWFYLNNYYSQVSQSGGAATTKSLATLSSCMRIEEASQNNFFVRNCGTGLITNDSLNVYIDDNRFSFSSSPASIDPGKTGTLSVQGVWNLSMGQHTLRITNPNFETSAMFDAELPNSCAMDLEFDEGSGTTAHDSSGNVNNGVFNGEIFNDGTIYGATRVSGKYGNALQFDGTSNYIDTGKTFSALGLGNNFSVFMWVKPMLVDSNWHTVIGDWDFGNKGHFSIDIWNDNNWSASTVINGAQDTVEDKVNVVAGNWYYIGFTLALNGEFALWVNGSKVASQMITTPFSTTSTRTIKIGDRGDGAVKFNGIIDEVRIFNRSLSQAEIQAEMQSSLPVSRPIASYSFESGDTAGYANDTHIWVKGISGSALSFDGINDYFNANMPQHLDVLTVEYWAKSSSGLSTESPNWLFQVGKSVDWQEFDFGWQGWSDGITFSFKDETDTRQVLDTSNIYMNAGRWYNLVGSYDGHYIKIYLDGSLIGSANVGSHTIEDYAVPFSISSNLVNKSFAIDGVRIFNQALASDQTVNFRLI